MRPISKPAQVFPPPPESPFPPLYTNIAKFGKPLDAPVLKDLLFRLIDRPLRVTQIPHLCFAVCDDWPLEYCEFHPNYDTPKFKEWAERNLTAEMQEMHLKDGQGEQTV